MKAFQNLTSPPTLTPAKNFTESRVKFLRIALQEAVRAGEKEAAKRLTAKLAKLLA